MLAEQTKTCAKPVTNQQVAALLAQVAGCLEEQGANVFRVRAYRTAAQVLQARHEPIAILLDREGQEGIERLHGIGHSLAHSIGEIVQTGKLRLLERLRGELRGEDPLGGLPSIGPQLAKRVRQQLGIDSLEDLELAAYDGRLAAVPGFGLKRVRAVRDVLAGRFGRRGPPAGAVRRGPQQPGVAELLDIDAQYRSQAGAGRLPSAAPKRFNPTGAAWLPILHTERGSRHYTVMYSNTARAHESAAVHDWVVILRDDKRGRGQWTVITSSYSPLEGRRVVRGREEECRAYYDDLVTQKELPLA